MITLPLTWPPDRCYRRPEGKRRANDSCSEAIEDHNTGPLEVDQTIGYTLPTIDDAKRICGLPTFFDANTLHACYKAEVDAQCTRMNVTYKVISLCDVMTLVDFDYRSNKLTAKGNCNDVNLRDIIVNVNGLLDASMPHVKACAAVGVDVEWSIGSMILWCTEPTEEEKTWYRKQLQVQKLKIQGLMGELHALNATSKNEESQSYRVGSKRRSTRNDSDARVETIDNSQQPRGRRAALNVRWKEANTEKEKWELALHETVVRDAITADERTKYMNVNKLVLVWGSRENLDDDDHSDRVHSKARSQVSTLPRTTLKLVGAATICKFVSSSLHTTSLLDVGSETHTELMPYFDSNYYYIDVMCSRKKGVGTLLVCLALLLARDGENKMDGVIALSFKGKPIKNDEIPDSLPIFLKCNFEIIIPLVAYPSKNYYGVWLVRTFNGHSIPYRNE